MARLFKKLFITNFLPLDSNLVLTTLYSMWINILILSTILTSRRGSAPYSVTQGLYGQMCMIYFTPAPAVPEVSPQQNMHLHTIYSLFKVQIIKSGRLNKWCLIPDLSLWEDVWCERVTGTFAASELYSATHTYLSRITAWSLCWSQEPQRVSSFWSQRKQSPFIILLLWPLELNLWPRVSSSS